MTGNEGHKHGMSAGGGYGWLAEEPIGEGGRSRSRNERGSAIFKPKG